MTTGHWMSLNNARWHVISSYSVSSLTRVETGFDRSDVVNNRLCVAFTVRYGGTTSSNDMFSGKIEISIPIGPL